MLPWRGRKNQDEALVYKGRDRAGYIITLLYMVLVFIVGRYVPFHILDILTNKCGSRIESGLVQCAPRHERQRALVRFADMDQYTGQFFRGFGEGL